MAADNILGKLLIEGANQAASIAGGNPSLGSGLAGGGGGTGTRAAERETRSFQKTVKDAQIKSVAFAKNQPQWWTRMFKTLGIQMGLAGILKQSQVFTSTVGAFFQIFGAMVDVMLAPLVKPVLIPVMRWLARQIPTMGKLSRAIFGFLGNTALGIVRVVRKIGGWVANLAKTEFWSGMFNGVVDAIVGLPGKIAGGIKKFLQDFWNSKIAGTNIFGWDVPRWGGAETERVNKEGILRWPSSEEAGDVPQVYSNAPSTPPTNTGSGSDGPSHPIINAANAAKDRFNQAKDNPTSLSTIGAGAALILGVLGTVASAAKMAELTAAAAKYPFARFLGMAEPFLAQLNPWAQQNLYGQMFRQGGVKAGAKIAFANMMKGLMGDTPILNRMVPNQWLGAGEEALDSAYEVNKGLPNNVRNANPPVPRKYQDYTRPVVNNAEDMAPRYSDKSSKLTKARQLLAKLTTWLGQQLRNLKTLILNPSILEQAKNNLKTKVDEIVNLLKTVTGTEAQNIIARARFLGRFLGRVAPIVGAGIAALETGFNVKRILGSELPWFGDANTEVDATAALKKLQEIEDMGLGKATHSWSSPMGIGKNLINLGFGKELKGNLVGATSQELWAQNTKGGAILSQLLMGTLSTGTGALGAPGIPLSVGMGISQLMMTEQALSNSANNQAFQASLQQLNDNLALGLQSTQKQINMTMEGNPVILDVYQ